MFSDQSSVLTISQAHLRVWDTCPRQFRYAYLDRLAAPLPISRSIDGAIAEATALQLGSQFHLILQQQSLGLDVEALLKGGTKLHSWFNAFQQFAASLPDGEHLTEHRRTLLVDGQFQLTVVFDLLILLPDRALILDWKTHQKALSAQILAQSWQTRLYLYVLAETSGYLPAQLSITYWFANVGQQVKISYSNAQHLQTEQDLRQRLADIKNCGDMPKLAEGSASCDRCQFRYLCWQPEQKSTVIDYPEIEI
jgi:CRISPR/Cas system-associated exonuclease Cas4 (RecB family)